MTSNKPLNLEDLSTITRADIESMFNISGKKGKEGTTFIAKCQDDSEYAIKLFKKKKSVKKLNKEAALQKMAAEFGISPMVFAVNDEEKYIIMEKMEKTIVDVMIEKYGNEDRPLDEYQQKRIIDICEKLDQAKVLQNDGNPLNLMVNSQGEIFVIDFGFAKPITKAIIKKRGPNPNINLTLWHFDRQLRHYRINGDLLKQRIEEYKQMIQ